MLDTTFREVMMENKVDRESKREGELSDLLGEGK
jgi:hypothetical protein